MTPLQDVSINVPKNRRDRGRVEHLPSVGGMSNLASNLGGKLMKGLNLLAWCLTTSGFTLIKSLVSIYLLLLFILFYFILFLFLFYFISFFLFSFSLNQK